MQLRLRSLQQELKASAPARELKREKERLESYQRNIQEKNKELEQLTRDIREKDSVCLSLRDKRRQLEHKLYSGDIRNLKELDNLQHKVQITGQEINLMEERIMELILHQERLKEWVVENNRQFLKDKADYRERLTRYRTWRESLIREIDILTVGVAQLEEEIETDLCKLLYKLQKHLGLKALARVEKGTCSSCHLAIPSVLLQEIRSGKLIYCESCGRLLLL